VSDKEIFKQSGMIFFPNPIHCQAESACWKNDPQSKGAQAVWQSHPLTISGSINQLFAVACLLVNYQNGPLVRAWAKPV
jgi:hypothetical protein